MVEIANSMDAAVDTKGAPEAGVRLAVETTKSYVAVDFVAQFYRDVEEEAWRRRGFSRQF